MIGTPWPNCAELEREAEAIYYNQDPLDKTRVPKKWKIRDANGKETVIQMDIYRDPRLQERQMRVWYHEFNQAAFRSRPLSVDDTGQLELGDDGKESPKKRLHLFAQVLPAMPITQIIDGEIESVPELHADVLRVIREHCQEHDCLPKNQQVIADAISTKDRPVTKQRVNNEVYRWMNKREGVGWTDRILDEVRAERQKPPETTGEPLSKTDSRWTLMDVIPPQAGGGATQWRAKEPQAALKQDKPPTDPVERNTS